MSEFADVQLTIKSKGRLFCGGSLVGEGSYVDLTHYANVINTAHQKAIAEAVRKAQMDSFMELSRARALLINTEKPTAADMERMDREISELHKAIVNILVHEAVGKAVERCAKIVEEGGDEINFEDVAEEIRRTQV